MIKNENNIKIIKRSQNSIPESNISDIKKNASFSKENHITLNNNNSNIKKSCSNHLLEGTTGDDSKSKSSLCHKSKKLKKKLTKKSKSMKNKKRDKEKIAKLLKNERLKIPTGKRMSIANNKIKINLNNIEKIIKSLPKNNIRLDTYGNQINKENKKNVHIRFLDNIPSNELIEIIPIQSFKQLNIIEKIPDEQLISICSKCCQIF